MISKFWIWIRAADIVIRIAQHLVS